MKFIAEILLILAEFALAVVGIFENVSDKFRWWNSLFDDSLKATSTILILMVAVLALYVALKLAIEGRRSVDIKTEIDGKTKELVAAVDQIRTTINALSPELSVEVVHEHDFYSKFADRLRNAGKLAYISHLDVVPPQNYYLQGTQAFDYYKQIFEIIRSNPKLPVRRVERVSKEKISWIEKHIEELKGVPNFSLSCYVESPSTALPKSISVQCVDDTDAILVAVAKHSNPTEPRDIWLCGDSVTKMWRQYFEQRLLANAQPIIVNGVVDAKAWDILKASL
ncbi:hypothetical protein ACLIJR_08990 [Hydrogenophaga sp. XSHU_21]